MNTLSPHGVTELGEIFYYLNSKSCLALSYSTFLNLVFFFGLIVISKWSTAY
jgi:hypothetical protein